MQQQDQTKSADENAIDVLIEAWLSAHNSGNAEAFNNLYAADADFIGIDGQVVKGRDAIVGMYAQIFSQLPGNKANIALDSRQFIASEIVIDDGTWEVIGFVPDGAPTKGRYTTIFRKEDDEWRIVSARSMVPVTLTAYEA